MIFFNIAVFIFLIAVLWELMAIHRFFRYLEAAHPKTYEALGSPKWRIQFGDIVLRNAIRYIRTKAFEPLGDEQLMAHYRSIRSAERLAALMAAAALIIAVLDAFRPLSH